MSDAHKYPCGDPMCWQHLCQQDRQRSHCSRVDCPTTGVPHSHGPTDQERIAQLEGQLAEAKCCACGNLSRLGNCGDCIGLEFNRLCDRAEQAESRVEELEAALGKVKEKLSAHERYVRGFLRMEPHPVIDDCLAMLASIPHPADEKKRG